MKLPSIFRAGVLLTGLLLMALGGGSRTLIAQPASGAASLMAMAVAQQSDELPAGEAGEVLPLSMRPFYHVFAAFGLAWLLIFGYAVSLRRRIAALEREVDLLAS